MRTNWRWTGLRSGARRTADSAESSWIAWRTVNASAVGGNGVPKLICTT